MPIHSHLALSGHLSEVFLESLDFDGSRIFQSWDLFNFVSFRIQLASEWFDFTLSGSNGVIQIQHLLLAVANFRTQRIYLMGLKKGSLSSL